ncbi:MAG: Rieske 2Fe-2S domain-containing protein, partial [Rhodospirillales bacterium]|nr:Rieske 2Fe-2S domain-containing protein [Rhodospirillales bacterium]
CNMRVTFRLCFDGWFCTTIKTGNPHPFKGAVSDQVGTNTVNPFDFLDMPLVAVRGSDNHVRVFHNICPYDGCLAVHMPGTGLKSIDTYYHGWRYDLEGRLIDAPYWNGNPNCTVEDLNGIDGDLSEVRSETRMGVVFVNLGGNAEDIDKWLSPWKTTVSKHFAIDKLLPARNESDKPLIEKRTVAANWKTYQENASINTLHEAFTHETYRKSPEVPRVDRDGNRMFKEYMDGCLVAFSHKREETDDTYDPILLPSAGHDPSKQPEVGYFSTIYPNLNVPLLDSMIKINIVIPVSATETRLMHLRFYRPEALACDNFQEEELAVHKAFHTFHMEDKVAIEAVQQARRSPVWRQHYYAPFWDSLHHYFNQLVMQDMAAEPDDCSV